MFPRLLPPWSVQCKHIWAVQFSLSRPKRKLRQELSSPVSFDACIFCSSPSIIKFGVRHNKYGNIQKFQCKSCNNILHRELRLWEDEAQPTSNNDSHAVVLLRRVTTGILLGRSRLIGAEVSHQTIYRWIAKYTESDEQIPWQDNPAS